jgi:hypothetical protein
LAFLDRTSRVILFGLVDVFLSECFYSVVSRNELLCSLSIGPKAYLHPAIKEKQDIITNIIQHDESSTISSSTIIIFFYDDDDVIIILLFTITFLILYIIYFVYWVYHQHTFLIFFLIIFKEYTKGNILQSINHGYDVIKRTTAGSFSLG